MITVEEAQKLSLLVKNHIVEKLTHKLPDIIRQKILLMYEKIGRGAVVLRPSPVLQDEFDDPDSSCHDAFIGVQGEEELIRHVLLCWASAFSPKIVYILAERGHGMGKDFELRDPVLPGNPPIRLELLRIGFKPEDLALPLLVQKIAPVHVTGIAHRHFDGTPRITVRAAYGLGAGLRLNTVMSQKEEQSAVVGYDWERLTKKQKFQRGVDVMSGIAQWDMEDVFWQEMKVLQRRLPRRRRLKAPKRKPPKFRISAPDAEVSSKAEASEQKLAKSYRLQILASHPLVSRRVGQKILTSGGPLLGKDSRTIQLTLGAKGGIEEKPLTRKQLSAPPVGPKCLFSASALLLKLESLMKTSLSVEFGVTSCVCSKDPQRNPFYLGGDLCELVVLDVKTILAPLPAYNFIPRPVNERSPLISIMSLFGAPFPLDELSLSATSELIFQVVPPLRSCLVMSGGRLWVDTSAIFSSRYTRNFLKEASGSSDAVRYLQREYYKLVQNSVPAGRRSTDSEPYSFTDSDLCAVPPSISDSDTSESEGEPIHPPTITAQPLDAPAKPNEMTEQPKAATDGEADFLEDELRNEISTPRLAKQIFRSFRGLSRKAERVILGKPCSINCGLKKSELAFSDADVHHKMIFSKAYPQFLLFSGSGNSPALAPYFQQMDNTNGALSRVMFIIQRATENLQASFEEIQKTFDGCKNSQDLQTAVLTAADFAARIPELPWVKTGLEAAAVLELCFSIAQKRQNKIWSLISNERSVFKSSVVPEFSLSEILEMKRRYESGEKKKKDQPRLRVTNTDDAVPRFLHSFVNGETIFNKTAIPRGPAEMPPEPLFIRQYNSLLSEIVTSSEKGITLKIGKMGLAPPRNMPARVPSAVKVLSSIPNSLLKEFGLLGGLGGLNGGTYYNKSSTMKLEARFASVLKRAYETIDKKSRRVPESQVLVHKEVQNNIEVMSVSFAHMATAFPASLTPVSQRFLTSVPLQHGPGFLIISLRSRLLACHATRSLHDNMISSDRLFSKQVWSEEELDGEEVKEQDIPPLFRVSSMPPPTLLRTQVICCWKARSLLAASQAPSEQNDPFADLKCFKTKAVNWKTIFADLTVLRYQHTFAKSIISPFFGLVSHIIKQALFLAFIGAMRMGASKFLGGQVAFSWLKYKGEYEKGSSPVRWIPEQIEQPLSHVLQHLYLGEALLVLLTCASGDTSSLKGLVEKSKAMSLSFRSMNSSSLMADFVGEKMPTKQVKEKALTPKSISQALTVIWKSRMLSGISSALSPSPFLISSIHSFLPQKDYIVAASALPDRAIAWDTPIVISATTHLLPARLVGVALLINPTEDPVETLRTIDRVVQAAVRRQASDDFTSAESETPFPNGIILFVRGCGRCGSGDIVSGLQLLLRLSPKQLKLPVVGIVLVGSVFISPPSPTEFDTKKWYKQFEAVVEAEESRAEFIQKIEREKQNPETAEKALNTPIPPKVTLPKKLKRLTFLKNMPFVSVSQELLDFAFENRVPIVVGLSEAALLPPEPITTGSFVEIHFLCVAPDDVLPSVITACCETGTFPQPPPPISYLSHFVHRDYLELPNAVVSKLKLSELTQGQDLASRTSLRPNSTVIAANKQPRPPSTLLSYASYFHQQSFRSSKLSQSSASGALSFKGSSSSMLSSALTSVQSIRMSAKLITSEASSASAKSTSLSGYYSMGRMSSALRLSAKIRGDSRSSYAVSQAIRKEVGPAFGKAQIGFSTRERAAGMMIKDAWRRYTIVRDLRNEVVREMVVKEIRQTEIAYNRNMKLFFANYVESVAQMSFPKKFAVFKSIADSLFANLQIIIQSSDMMLDLISKPILEWNRLARPPPTIAHKLHESFVALASYMAYATQYSKYLLAFLETNCPRTVTKQFEAATVEFGLQPFDYYLIQPIQRVPRYALLVERLLEKTSCTHPDFERLSEVAKLVGEFLVRIDKARDTALQLDKVIKISRCVHGLKPTFVQPGRRFIKESVPSSISVLQLGPDAVCELAPHMPNGSLLVPLRVAPGFESELARQRKTPADPPVLPSDVRFTELPYPFLAYFLLFSDCVLVVNPISEETFRRASNRIKNVFRKTVRADRRDRSAIDVPANMVSPTQLEGLAHGHYELLAFMPFERCTLIPASIVAGRHHQTFQLRTPDALVTVSCPVFDDYVMWVQEFEGRMSRFIAGE
eukprot:gnl/Chilomastix_cuspidata/4048.p1 GENE.gnl/Chilomastix_cuspidata/4048~~gnl/Chilomastix_cuspidata/4048.p1  ORF type:complete len:2262 (-),score=401.26 gnl/Chilomastix_cuspidata/4048:33-6566(-)